MLISPDLHWHSLTPSPSVSSPPHLLAAYVRLLSIISVELGSLQRHSPMEHLDGGREKTCSLSKSLNFGMKKILGAGQVAPACELNRRYFVPWQRSWLSQPSRNSHTPTLVISAWKTWGPSCPIAWHLEVTCSTVTTFLVPGPPISPFLPCLHSIADHTHIAFCLKVVFYSSLS